MAFEVSAAREEVLEKLAERDWTATDLADELGKSTPAVYNHLDALADSGVVSKRQVAAKTRPKTEYSIDDGFVQYIAVLPGQYARGTLPLDDNKRALLSIWTIPQPEFHPYLESLWFQLRAEDGLVAVALYGSVARGDADDESDIDVLLIAEEEVAERLKEVYGTQRLKYQDGTKLGMAQVYTPESYRKSLAGGSDFLDGIQNELHVVFDPRNVLSPVPDDEH
jgi:predicted nucleotidyltransferase